MGTSCGCFSGASYLLLPPSPPSGACLITGAGGGGRWGEGAAGSCLQTQFWLRRSLAAPGPLLQKLYLQVQNQGFQPGQVAWAGRGTLGRGEGVRRACDRVLKDCGDACPCESPALFWK